MVPSCGAVFGKHLRSAISVYHGQLLLAGFLPGAGAVCGPRAGGPDYGTHFAGAGMDNASAPVATNRDQAMSLVGAGWEVAPVLPARCYPEPTAEGRRPPSRRFFPLGK
jgi:hypothetical protein